MRDDRDGGTRNEAQGETTDDRDGGVRNGGAADERSGDAPDDPPEGANANWMPPVRFAAETLGVSLWSRQKDVLDALMRERRVAVKSGNGLGKDFTAAVAVLWYLHCHEPAIVLSTAPTFRQVRYVLWRQIHRLHRMAADTLGGRLLDTRWELSEDRYAMGLSADGADQFQGFHCENVLVVVDEAEGVEEEIYEAIDGVMTSRNPKLLLIGNPTSTAGTFHRAFHQHRGIYTTLTISALESPNVQNGEIEIPGLVTAKWVNERRIIWGEDSDMFRARVLGEFPKRGEDNLISMDDIEAALCDDGGRSVLRQAQDERSVGASGGMGAGFQSAHNERRVGASGGIGAGFQSAPDDRSVGEAVGMGAGFKPAPDAPGNSPLMVSLSNHERTAAPVRERHESIHDPFGLFLPGMSPLGYGRVVVGVDVARFGSDRTVVLTRRDDTVESIRAFSRIDTMAAAGQVMAAVREYMPDLVNVDVIGVGAGIVDRLHEQGMRVRGVNVAEKPRRDRFCANLRAEGYQSLARRFHERRIRIPRDAELISELATLRYQYDSRGRLLIQSKDSMRKRGLASPDKADALMLAFLDDDPAAAVG